MTKGVAEGNLLLELWFPKDKEHRLHRDSSHVRRPESANSHLFLWEGLGLVEGAGGSSCNVFYREPLLVLFSQI